MSTKAEIILSGDDAPLRKALASARENLNRFGNEATQPFAKIRDAVGNLGNIMAGLGAIKLTQLADEAALIQARLKDVSGSFAAAQQAQAALYASAQRLQVSYGDMAGSFARMLPAVQQMGGGAAEAVRLSEILAVTARLAGASSAEAASSAQQFAQALSSGVLQGEDLKSILENNNTLARALAQGLGVTVGELRKLGSEGKLTADKVAGALLGQYDQIQARSAELPATVGGAWQQLTNAFQQFTAAANEGTGVFAGVSAILSGLARVIDAVRVSFAGTSSEADKLGRNQSIKAWGESVGAVFAWVIDMGRAAMELIEAVGRNIGGWAAAIATAARGDLRGAKAIWDEMAADAEKSFRKIQDLMTGGKGSTLNNYALNSGQDAGGSLTPAGKLHSTAPAAKKKGDEASIMNGFELAVQEQMALLSEHKRLLDGAKQYELNYWEQVLESAKLGEKEKLEIKKKIATLKLEVERENARTESQLQKEEVDAWREMQLIKLDGARIIAKTMHDQDQLTKSQLIDKEIEFEERRLQIQLEYLSRKQAMLAPNDTLGQMQIGNEMNAERQRSGNKKSELGGEKARVGGGFDFGGMADSMGAAVSQSFGQMITKATTWQNALLDIYKKVRDGFIKAVVMEPMQAQLAAWGKQLAAKLGFLAQQQGADVAASTATVATKTAEATAVTSAHAVEAGTGAAASQAMIPVIGPGMALASMAGIFAAVMAMGGSMKSARNGYDIPAGVNPFTQLHEEEMVLPKEHANAVRSMASTGGVSGSGPVVNISAMDAKGVAQALRKGGALEKSLRGLHRDFVKVR